MTTTMTKETRRESFISIMDKVGERHKQCILGLLDLGGLATANELAMHLHQLGKTPHFNRNYVHPRLNELVEKKIVEVVGKRKDEATNRNVAIYKVV